MIAFEFSIICTISIHAPRVGSDHHPRRAAPAGIKISIHAPRVGSDHQGVEPPSAGSPISIHAPRVGSDPFPGCSSPAPGRDFNPRSPCGERPGGRGRDTVGHISIHAPRVGSDVFDPDFPGCWECISIHAPRVGSDGRRQPAYNNGIISIHAPRVGSDLCIILKD